jgi:hypothetical protein
MASRIQLCKAKGFVAVDADNVDGYTNPTGEDNGMAMRQTDG